MMYFKDAPMLNFDAKKDCLQSCACNKDVNMCYQQVEQLLFVLLKLLVLSLFLIEFFTLCADIEFLVLCAAFCFPRFTCLDFSMATTEEFIMIALRFTVCFSHHANLVK